MSGLTRRLMMGLAIFLHVWFSVTAFVQAEDSTGSAPKQAQPAERGYRRLAPGVLTEIPAHKSLDESLQRLDLPSISGKKPRDWKPADVPPMTTLKGLTAAGYVSSRGVWCLDFAFMPPRLIDAEVPNLSQGSPPAPQAEGTDDPRPLELRNRLTRLWYLVYRVKNVAGRRVRIEGREEGADGQPLETFEKPVSFMPLFIFETREALDELEGIAAYRAYADQVIPGAAEAIRKREGPGPKLHDSASIAVEPLEVGEERWGVATWEGIDPRIDFFSILVRGLTNRLEYRPGDAKKLPETALECLVMDFRRSGDPLDLDDQEVMVGYEGLFERVSLGTTLVDAANRVRNTRARPREALNTLALEWSDLLTPERSERDSLEPGVQLERGVLATVVARIAAQPTLETRGAVTRARLGDESQKVLETVTAALVQNVTGNGGQTAFDLEGVDTRTIAADPLKGLAGVLAALDGIEPIQSRTEMEQKLFGREVSRVRILQRAVLAARTVAVLESVGFLLKPFSTLSPQEAFSEVSRRLETEPGKRDTPAILRGLFGPEGPWMYRDAIRSHEGIDHRWVFRYERE
ncbi:MAG: hypothetical protein ACKOCN_11535 [Planctomycetaceae bacterium]